MTEKVVIFMALIDIVKFNGLASRNWIVYKHYAEDLSTATQLIVGEGQVAVFIKGGRICDMFGPGTYTLTTNNIPILSSLINLPFGGKTPFSAEIYYINALTKLDLTWGTSDCIQLVDPKYHIRLKIRAFGQVGLKISDYTMFIRELIGSMSGAEIIDYNRVLDFYKGFLNSKVKSFIAQIIIQDQISALEISAKLSEISDKISDMLAPDFAKFGMTLVNFYVKSINFPEEDFDKINRILEEKAAFEIMGDSRYAAKRSFDVYEGAANNENGVAGAFAAGGLGFGAASAMGNAAAHAQNIMQPLSSADIYCPKCNAPNKHGTRFCCNCGASFSEINEKIKCPNCSALNEPGARFCNNCGKSLEEKICECGMKIKAGDNFCSGCGRKVSE